MTRECKSAARTVVLGVDGMDLLLVERWASEGHLPFLAEMLATCPIASLSTPSRVLQGAVWPSMLTGVSPGRHGTYLQTQLASGSYDLTRIRTVVGDVENFYTFLGSAGVRCGVADIPVDAPQRGFPGVQIVDWGTEFSFWGFATEPPELARTLRRDVGTYPIPLDRQSGDTTALHLELFNLLQAGVARKGELARHLLARGDLDLLFVVFMEAHKAGHWLWKYGDPSHPDHDVSAQPELRHGLRSCYARLDRELRELAELTAGDNLLIVSDHGMQANYRGDHLAEPILERLGLLTRKGEPSGRGSVVRQIQANDPPEVRRWLPMRTLRRLAPKSLKPGLRALFNLPRIDWRRTRAFVLPTDRNTYVRVNLKGREPDGQVAPGLEYDRLLDRIERELRALTNVTTGQPAVSEVFRMRALYPGPCAENLPDLVVLWSADAPLDAVASTSVGVVAKPIRELRSGNHREEGFVLARGPSFRTGSIRLSGDILEIAPTLLALHGVDLPAQLEKGPLSLLREAPAPLTRSPSSAA